MRASVGQAGAGVKRWGQGARAGGLAPQVRGPATLCVRDMGKLCGHEKGRSPTSTPTPFSGDIGAAGGGWRSPLAARAMRHCNMSGLVRCSMGGLVRRNMAGQLQIVTSVSVHGGVVVVDWLHIVRYIVL